MILVQISNVFDALPGMVPGKYVKAIWYEKHAPRGLDGVPNWVQFMYHGPIRVKDVSTHLTGVQHAFSALGKADELKIDQGPLQLEVIIPLNQRMTLPPEQSSGVAENPTTALV